MKRLLPLLLILVLLCGCAQPQSFPEETTETPTEPEYIPPVDPSALEAVTIQETVIYDKDGITATVTGLKMNESGLGDPLLAVSIENGTDKDIYFELRQFSVNGYAIGLHNCTLTLPAGASESVEMALSWEHLLQTEIKTMAEFAFVVTISDIANSYAKLDELPVSIPTSRSDFVQPELDKGTELYNQDGVLLCARKILPPDSDSKLTEFELELYVENNTDMYLGFTFRDVKLNGLSLTQANNVAGSAIGAGLRGIIYLSLPSPRLLGVDQISQVQNVSFNLDLYNHDANEHYLTIPGIVYAPVDGDYVQVLEIEGTEIYNDKGLRIVLGADFTENDPSSYVPIYIENSSDEMQHFELLVLEINGEEQNVTYAAFPSVSANAQGIAYFYIGRTDQDTNIDTLLLRYMNHAVGSEIIEIDVTLP